MHSYQYCNVLVLNPTLYFHVQVISHEENQHHAVVYAFFLAGISFNFSHSWFYKLEVVMITSVVDEFVNQSFFSCLLQLQDLNEQHQNTCKPCSMSSPNPT
jgi:hypothetical protein